MSSAFSNRLIDVLHGLHVESGMIGERIDRSGITVGKLLCVLNHIMSRWVVILKLPGFSVFSHLANWEVNSTLLAVAIISSFACIAVSGSRLLLPSSKQL